MWESHTSRSCGSEGEKGCVGGGGALGEGVAEGGVLGEERAGRGEAGR